MNAYLQVMTPGGDRFPVDGESVTIGRDPDNDVALVSDPTVSQLHAVVRRYPSGWSVCDLNSRNGTYVNGRRLAGECRLRPQDEIGVGNVRLVFRAEGAVAAATSSADGAPPISPAERRVLVALCRPLVSGDPFPQPASVSEMADALVLGAETVKWHLKNLTRKFDIPEGSASRRIALANEAIRRRAVTLADLQEDA